VSFFHSLLQPESEQFPQLTTLLLPHQRKAVAWMLLRERTGSVAAALAAQSSFASKAAIGAHVPPGTDPLAAQLAVIAKSALRPIYDANQFFFWRRQPAGTFFNAATQSCVAADPVLARGGIIADAMGLGKTLTMIAVIVASKTVRGTHRRIFLKRCHLNCMLRIILMCRQRRLQGPAAVRRWSCARSL
jgi:SNF2 family DNA or RNA helicase